MSYLDTMHATAIAALKRRIEQLENIQGGAGVKVHRGPGGIIIAASPVKATSPSKRDVTGDAIVLDQTQGIRDTDTYDRATDKKPVEFDVVTDIKYDAETHKLTFRTRTITAVGITGVSAESDPIEVFEAEECAAEA